MTKQGDEEMGVSKILQFSKRPSGTSSDNAEARGTKTSAAKIATLAEESHNAEIYDQVVAAMSGATLAEADQIMLAINMRKLIYDLKDEGRLDPKQLGRDIRGTHTPLVVGAIAEYVTPEDATTFDEYRLKYPKRRLAKKAGAYLKLADAVAKRSGMHIHEAVVKLATGTSFWPEVMEGSDVELRAARQVMAVLDDVAAALDRSYPMARYFETMERLQLVPVDIGGKVVCVNSWDGEYAPWEHKIYPAVRIAGSLIAEHPATLCIREKGESDDAWVERLTAGQGMSVDASERKIFSLAAARIGGRNRIVGLFTRELVLSRFSRRNGEFQNLPGDIVSQWRSDQIGEGWRPVEFTTKNGNVEGAWVLDEFPSSDWEMDLSADADLKPIDVNFLRREHDGYWRARGSGSAPSGWRSYLDDGPTRIGSLNSLPRLIERALIIEEIEGGAIQELAALYAKQVAAMEQTRDQRHRYIEGELERLRERVRDPDVDLTGGPPSKR